MTDLGNVPDVIKFLNIMRGIKNISQIKSSSLVGSVSVTFAIEIDVNNTNAQNTQ